MSRPGMHGVLTDTELWVMGVTCLIAADFVVVVDDGHSMPYAQAFVWPDGSQGMLIRLEEDGGGEPSLVELTHVASGRKVEISLPFSTYLATHTAASFAFDTVADMLASTLTFTFADCQNYEGTDGILSSWKVLPETTTLTDNDDDVRTRGDGRLVIRHFVREP